MAGSSIDGLADYVDASCLDMIAEQRNANAVLLEQGRRLPPASKIDIQKLRASRLQNPDGSFKPFVANYARDELLTTSEGPVAIRVFSSGGEEAVLVHFHGGGWALGSIHEQDLLLDTLARTTRCKVISVAYPLAPESELAHTLLVARAATSAIVRTHPREMICIAGESAGAHIALQALLGLPDVRARICAISLSYGIYDLSMTPSQRLWGSEFLGLSTDWLERFYELALPGKSMNDRSAPEYSPLYASLQDLPPALFSVGTLDPLLDDTLFMHARWRASECPADLRVYPEAPHGFNHMDTAMGRHCNTTIAGFLRDRISAAQSSKGAKRANG